jgi:AcrR family transcriptional regulator
VDRARRRGNSRLPQLLDEAAHAFASRGFAAASVREIVGPIGMLPGSLYCHFATKEALLVAVYREGVERISAALDAAVAASPTPGRGSRRRASRTSPRCSTRPTIRRS